MSRGITEFVLVKRLLHNDEMVIPKFVAEKYPNKFEIVEVEKPKPKVKRVRNKKVEPKVEEE